jgi:hypothetical protein
MVEAHLFRPTTDGGTEEIGAYPFHVLPRTGEVIVVYYDNEFQRYEVVRLEHHFRPAPTDPPLILIRIRRID